MPYPLDYPDMKKVVFVDESMNLQSPPTDSRVYAYLRQEQPVTSSSLDQALEVQSHHP